MSWLNGSQGRGRLLLAMATAGLMAVFGTPARAAVVTYTFQGVADPPNTPYLTVSGSFSYDTGNLQIQNGVTYLLGSDFINPTFIYYGNGLVFTSESGTTVGNPTVSVDPTTLAPTSQQGFTNSLLVNIGGDNNEVDLHANANQVFVLNYFQVGSFIGGHGDWTESGYSQSAPLLPTGSTGTQYTFSNVASGQWYDPQSASGFIYAMTTPGEYFTDISGFPTGFNGPFTVSVDGQVLGTNFGPSSDLNFADYGYNNVTQFTVTGVNPSVDPSNTSAFPLEIDFSQQVGSFTMDAITAPEPASLSLVASGILAAGGLATQRRRQWTAILQRGIAPPSHAFLASPLRERDRVQNARNS